MQLLKNKTGNAILYRNAGRRMEMTRIIFVLWDNFMGGVLVAGN
jgi:hypothetical protein